MPRKSDPHRYTIAMSRGRWFVFDRNAEVAGPFVSRKAAQSACNHKRSSDGKVTRKCMTCWRSFKSEGIHNRMCDRCRSKGSSALEVAV